jgi:twitching motility two-component system response regulator PilG
MSSRVAALEVLRQAMAAAKSNDTVKTRGLLLEVIRLDQDNETAWQWLATVAETPLEATAALERVLLLNPRNDKARADLKPVRLKAGMEAARGKDILTARRLLRTTVADDPNNEQGWFWLASVSESPHEAIAHLKRALALNPNNTAAKKGIDYYNGKIAKLSESGVMATKRSSGAIPIPAGAAPPPETPPPPRKLLVIDPNRTVRKLVSMAAAPEGFTVTEAGDAPEAIERVREIGTPDLVLVAANMPGMDGYEFCKVFRQSHEFKRVPVVMLTEREGLFDKLRGKVAGVDGVLHKPLEPAALAQALRTGRPAAAVAAV